MDVEAYLAELERIAASARPVPLSASVMVDKRELERAIAGLREQLPEDLRQSRWVLKERDEVLDQARREAERIVADARAEGERLVSETEVVHHAQREAERILEDAREEARVLRLEAEDYVDGKLANFEIVLQRTQEAVEKGRERLRGRLASDELAAGQEPHASGEPPPEPVEPLEAEQQAAAQFYDHEHDPRQ